MHFLGGTAVILLFAMVCNANFALDQHDVPFNTETSDNCEKVKNAFCDHKVQCAIEKNAALTDECHLKVGAVTKIFEERLSSAERERILEQKICDLKVMVASGKGLKDGVSSLNLLKLPTGIYYISEPTRKANWYLAGHFCKSNGLELASIETEAENAAILESIRGETDLFWISGTDLGSEGTFYWSATGKQIGPFTNFSYKQPDNHREIEDCLVLWTNTPNKEYAWNDGHCPDSYRFICEL